MTRQPRNKPKRARSGRPNETEMGELRLIGGKWKRTILTFPLLAGVRPTPSRVRETLFNWLANDIPGSHCLDLFAGSGALGMEALSRGAASCTFVDQQRSICTSLEQHIKRLNALDARVLQADAMAPQNLGFDEHLSPEIVFVDPPFNQDLVYPLLESLTQSAWFDSCKKLYLETESRLADINFPANWTLLREKKAGDVCYRLFSIQ